MHGPSSYNFDLIYVTVKVQCAAVCNRVIGTCLKTVMKLTRRMKVFHNGKEVKTPKKVEGIIV